MIHFTHSEIGQLKTIQRVITRRSSISSIFEDLYSYCLTRMQAESVALDFIPLEVEPSVESLFQLQPHIALPDINIKALYSPYAEDFVKPYLNYYHTIDFEGHRITKLYLRLWKKDPNYFYVGETNNKRYACPEFLNEACIPNKMIYNIGSGFMLNPNSAVHIALGKSNTPFSKHEKFRLSLVGQTVLSSIRNLVLVKNLAGQIHQQQQQISFLTAAISSSTDYAFFFSEDLQLLFMTPMASQLLDEWRYLPIEQGQMNNLRFPSLLIGYLQKYIDHSRQKKYGSLEILPYTVQLLLGYVYTPSITTILPDDNTDSLLFYMMRLQPHGFDSKLEMIRHTYGLSRRELEILKSYLLSGLTSKELSQIMKISAYTINDHFQNILFKCRLQSRKQLHLLL